VVAGPLGPGDGYGGYRSRLVEALRSKGIRDLAVLHAVQQVPRHLFVPESVRHRAYDDAALPIGQGQTISQPFVQARSIEVCQLRGHERVLEIGTGSGYQTALLGMLTETVFSVERVGSLARQARTVLDQLAMRNVSVMLGDGTLGWRPYAPYDAILVSAASPDIPAPLVDQLAPGGRMVIPIGDQRGQVLTFVERTPEGVRTGPLEDVRFVPLLGALGFRDS
jgi:protein-L-isoaspartate(D-aspartate) O-methyltransferase